MVDLVIAAASFGAPVRIGVHQRRSRRSADFVDAEAFTRFENLPSENLEIPPPFSVR